MVRIARFVLLLLASSFVASSGEQDKKFHFALIGVPLSPLHSLVAVGQELCERGHNVTVVSFGERGEKKTKKYSPVCRLNYYSLGPPPMTEEEEAQTMSKLSHLTNNTMRYMKEAVGVLFSQWFDALASGAEAAFGSGALKPDFALVSVPFGAVGHVLQRHGIDYAVNMPTVAAAPLLPQTAFYVPIAFHHTSAYNLGFVERNVVFTTTALAYYVKLLLSVVGFSFGAFPDGDPRIWWNRLVLINSFAGFDYPMYLPPLVQYTGPVQDLSRLEPFSTELEAFLEETPEGVPIVYVSFGTVAYLSEERVAAMAQTMSSDKYRVIWALPKNQQAGLPKKIPDSMFVSHWIPGPRTMAHPKVKAFVSHCGGNSAVEAMAWGVPIVGYPQFGDQPTNCFRIQDAGAGRTRPVGSWVQAEDIEEVLSTPSYAEHAERLSRIYQTTGGVKKAADLLQLAAHGDLEALSLPGDKSLTAHFRYSGYECTLVW
eukprot:CAMPEP_0206464100 /NCGR_PEP_ID=MMETSP0324_2-20121206/27011_1 /ASSEMBLY_ACC=CAM_ASM_000836 /TAXON_ID=2866 /ORGANISM="Crypthecodinium cohnii, Strain Seligo" /LENGTH=483 /DNA_ID=CAMNT_0053936659 /DNA_START=112 /DNA_END=1560 /DNA_ORIENTATION=+